MDILKQDVRVYSWKNGATDIKVYNVPKDTLEHIAEMTGKAIKEHEGTRWIGFAKARDGSSVTLFEE